MNQKEINELEPNMPKRVFYSKYIKRNKVTSRIILKKTNWVRIKLIDAKVFDELKSNISYDYHNIDGNKYIFGEESGGIDTHPGVLLASIGSYSIDATAGSLNYEFIRQLNSAYQCGHSRKRCDKVGMATYRSARGTNRVHPRPTVDENEIRYHQYYSQKKNKSHLIQFLTESIANKLGESALEFGKREHYPLFKHVGDTCDMTIITSGIPSSTNIDVFEKKESREVYNKRPFISFACTSHEDKCDRLSNKCKDHFINNFKVSVYMDDLITLLGCGLPTTCQYKHIWHSEDIMLQYIVHAYFQHDDLGIAHEITDMRAFTFLGFAYAHSTSICFLEKRNCDVDDPMGIIFMNKKDFFSMLAWGQTGGPKEYKRKHKINVSKLLWHACFF